MADIFTRPEEEDITQLRAKIEELEAELARLRLRSRVEEIEEELAREERQARAPQEEVEEELAREERQARAPQKDNGSYLMNEDIGIFIRALTLAHLEQLRLTADAVSAGVNETFQRNQAEGGRSGEDLVRELPKDICEGILKAAKEALHIPIKMVEKFVATSKEGERSEAKMASGTTGSRP
jgi:hypothetical protein